MRFSRASDERGMALALAVFALVVIGALVAGIYFSGQLEQRSGRNTAYAAQAFEAAEAGLGNEIGNWNGVAYNSLAVGGTNTGALRQAVTAGAPVTYSTTVTRLNGNVFLVRAVGERFRGTTYTDANLLGSRSLSLFARLVPVNIQINAAITARSDVQVGGNATIDGNDNAPPGWLACGSASPALPAIITSGTVSTNGSPNISGAGSPPYRQNQTIADSIFSSPYNQLVAAANLTMGSGNLKPNPVVSGTPATCNKTNILNWGDPTATTACAGYFPIIHITGTGTTSIQSNASGQGILLVDGNLSLAGGFKFNGIILVKGSFDASHGNNTIYGAVFSGSDASLDDVTITGTPTVRYSTCAINRVLNASAVAQPLRSRSWAQLYN